MLLAVSALAATLLAPCPDTPNCVSTAAIDDHRIAPIHFEVTPQVAATRLLAILEKMPRTKLVSSDAHIIRAEFRTAIFRFVDDAVFVIDASNRTIHFRSAARVGRYDFGVNRKRMELIRERFAAGAGRE